ncbi:MAG: hypothetical protein A2Y76_03925 [Planctomycetes bacterium RBG_13_60_9]|nr:MAG: hypothetical protein A2Y76_03925 [Planctomycetes bacterium RBG_13_60_9]
MLTAVLFAMSAVSAGRSTRLLGAGPANLSRLVLATGLLALFAAYARIGPRLGVLLSLCLAAPFGAFMEWVWLGTRLSLYQILWGTTILAGVFTALAPDKRVAMSARTWIVGVTMGAIAAVGQGGGAVLTRKAFDVAGHAGQHVDGATAAYQRILGGLLLTALVLLIHHWRKQSDPPALETPATDQPWRRAWPWVIANALAGPALGVACYQWALAVAPTGIVLSIVATTPWR